MHSARCSIGYMPHVDGLRAIAILAVVAYHAAPGIVSGGFVGVDVFFVISGFLITSIIAGELAEGRFTLISFFARRVRRIVPALVAVYIAAFAAAVVLLTPEALELFGRSLRASALFIANFHFYQTTNYFALPAHQRPLLHTWSLAIEEQFYILWPLLLLALSRWAPRIAIPGVILLAIALSLTASQVEALANPPRAFYMLSSRAWELMLGALLAVAAPQREWLARLAEPLAAAGLAAIVASVFLLDESTPFPGLAALPATLGTAAVIFASRTRPTATARLLSVPPLVGTGLISYSLYLWHWPLLAFATIALARHPGPGETAALVAASFAIAWLSWRYVESPFRRSGRVPAAGRSPRTVVVVGLAVLCLAAGTGVAMRAGDGWPWRLDEPARLVYAQKASENPYRIDCDGIQHIFGRDRRCNVGAPKPPSASYDIAIFGDSNADMLVPLVALHAKARGLSARQVTQSTCAPMFGVLRIQQPVWRETMCRSYQQEIVRFVAANPELKLALLAANWTTYHDPNILGHNGFAPDAGQAVPPNRGPVALQTLLAPTVRYFTERGISVMLIGRIPYREDATLTCAVAARRNGETGNACGIPADAVRKTLAVSDRVIRDIAAKIDGVTAALPSDLMCDREHCYAVMDGVYLYRNAGHLSGAGARHLAHLIPLPAVAGKPTH